MEIFWYLVFCAVIIWGILYLPAKVGWSSAKTPKMSKKIDPDWEQDFWTKLEEWKKDRGAGV